MNYMKEYCEELGNKELTDKINKWIKNYIDSDIDLHELMTNIKTHTETMLNKPFPKQCIENVFKVLNKEIGTNKETFYRMYYSVFK